MVAPARSQPVTVTPGGGVLLGRPLLPAAAEDGFLGVPAMQGAPSSTPVQFAGYIPLAAVDAAGGMTLYGYSYKAGEWQGVSGASLINGDSSVVVNENGTVVVTTAGVVAGTFDTSQNLTVAKNATVTGGTVTLGTANVPATINALDTLSIQTASTTAISVDGSQNVTLAGNVLLSALNPALRNTVGTTTSVVLNSSQQIIVNITNTQYMLVQSQAHQIAIFNAASTLAGCNLQMGASVDFLPGTGAATNMTTGFTYIPCAAGSPSGTPANKSTAMAPLYYDTTNKVLCVYDDVAGAWYGITLLTTPL